jgi:hypothetical protein
MAHKQSQTCICALCTRPVVMPMPCRCAPVPSDLVEQQCRESLVYPAINAEQQGRCTSDPWPCTVATMAPVVCGVLAPALNGHATGPLPLHMTGTAAGAQHAGAGGRPGHRRAGRHQRRAGQAGHRPQGAGGARRALRLRGAAPAAGAAAGGARSQHQEQVGSRGGGQCLPACCVYGCMRTVLACLLCVWLHEDSACLLAVCMAA